jgi:DnaK suppressor protein
MENADNFQTDAGDFADTATNIYEKELHLDLTEKNKQLLMDIEDALSRIDNGSYGTCEKCSSDISIERLKALPFAKKCIKCERGGKE